MRPIRSAAIVLLAAGGMAAHAEPSPALDSFGVSPGGRHVDTGMRLGASSDVHGHGRSRLERPDGREAFVCARLAFERFPCPNAGVGVGYAVARLRLERDAARHESDLDLRPHGRAA